MPNQHPKDTTDSLAKLREEIAICLYTAIDNADDEDSKRIEDEADAILAKVQEHYDEVRDEGAMQFRDRLSTGGYPLSQEPQIVKQPVPCPNCGATEYWDWCLYPHQVYNHYMPGGTGHYCFPCFARIVSQNSLLDELVGKLPDVPDDLHNYSGELRGAYQTIENVTELLKSYKKEQS